MGTGRLRLPVRPGRRRPDLPVAAGQPGRIHPARLRCQRRLLLHGCTARQGGRSPGQAPGAPARDRVRVRRPARRRDHARRRGSQGPGRGGAIPALQGGSAGGAARRPGHTDLHVGDDRPTEGRHAHAQQHLVQRDRVRRSTAGERGRQLPRLPAAVAYPRAHGGLLLLPRGRDHQLRAVHRHHLAGSAGCAPHGVRGGAALVREGVCPRARAGADGIGAQAPHLPVGEARRRAVDDPPALRDSRPARPRAAARHRRPAGVLEAARRHGRADQAIRFRRRPARRRDRALLLQRRARDHRGVRAHRNVAGAHAQPVGPAEIRHRGEADPRRPGRDRAGRRDPRQGPERHAELLQQARRDARGDRRGGVVPHGRHRRVRR